MTTIPRYCLVIDREATTSDDGSLPPERTETIEIGAVLADAHACRSRSRTVATSGKNPASCSSLG
jgi:inhibitor of KinA sporulation pathway (predicted exonuclease)